MNALSIKDVIQAAFPFVGQPLVWGQTDCASLTLRILGAVHGRDYWAVCRGQFNSVTTAARFVRDTGLTIEKYVVDHVGARVVDSGPRQVGDVLIFSAADHPALNFVSSGVYMGRGQLIMAEYFSNAVVLVPTAAAPTIQRVYRVPPCPQQ